MHIFLFHARHNTKKSFKLRSHFFRAHKCVNWNDWNAEILLFFNFYTAEKSVLESYDQHLKISFFTQITTLFALKKIMAYLTIVRRKKAKASFFPVVNFTNILRAEFAVIFLRQKSINLKYNYKKAVYKTFVEKPKRKILVKLVKYAINPLCLYVRCSNCQISTDTFKYLH